ncbi:germin-like protein 9-3 [Quercus lobata]|uniref:germin-like protein 9-3 n=1 Tax=Quercus lobata TaxID=97700 RepID=UPI001248F2F2|nr:germin-like protein 9-3 [Quercus lobata]
MAGDPEIFTDFIVPPNVTNVDENFFTFTGLRDLFKGGPSTTLKVSKVSLAKFSAINGQRTCALPYNADAQIPVAAIAAFGSANAGTVSIPNTLFTTGIDDVVLAKSFKTNTTTIEALKAGLAPPTP